MKIIELFENKLSPELEKKFGRILFGEWMQQEGMTRREEPDTRYESSVLDFVRGWCVGRHRDTKVQNKIIELSRIKDDYPTLLMPDSLNKYPVLYRALYGKQFSKWRHNDNSEKVGKIKSGNIYKYPKKFEYKPQKICEGWTISKRSAFEFMSGNVAYFDPRKVIILEAEIPLDERLFKIKFLNTLTKNQESEVIRVSKNPVMANVYYVETP